MVRSVSCSSKLSGVLSNPNFCFHHSFVRTSFRNLRGGVRFRVKNVNLYHYCILFAANFSAHHSTRRPC